MTVRDVGLEPQATWRPSAQWCHVGLGPGLVDEHQAGRVDLALVLHPLRPPARDIGAILLGCDQRLFL